MTSPGRCSAPTSRGARGTRFQWIVLVGGLSAGWLTLAVQSWPHGLAEIGYALSTSYQGRGVMPQALTQVLAQLFLEAPLHRIEARCHVENAASQRVLERVGFQREGQLRGYFILDGRRVDNFPLRHPAHGLPADGTTCRFAQIGLIWSCASRTGLRPPVQHGRAWRRAYGSSRLA